MTYAIIAAAAVFISTSTGSGSGTVLAHKDGMTLVLTAAHVVKGEPLAEIDGCNAFVDQRRDDLDLAILIVDCTVGAPIPVSTEEPPLFSRLLSVSSPAGQEGTAADQILTRKGLSIAGIPVNQITGLVYPGSSGGTLANPSGELVGVIVAVRTEFFLGTRIPVFSMGYSVPLSSIKEILFPYLTPEEHGSNL
jgi:S1-C subfamily serine protease